MPGPGCGQRTTDNGRRYLPRLNRVLPFCVATELGIPGKRGSSSSSSATGSFTRCLLRGSTLLSIQQKRVRGQRQGRGSSRPNCKLRSVSQPPFPTTTPNLGIPRPRLSHKIDPPPPSSLLRSQKRLSAPTQNRPRWAARQVLRLCRTPATATPASEKQDARPVGALLAAADYRGFAT